MNKEQIKAYEEQLKPCPFCGNKAKMWNEYGWFSAGCKADMPC